MPRSMDSCECIAGYRLYGQLLTIDTHKFTHISMSRPTISWLDYYKLPTLKLLMQ
jgi:hypothetical protein